MCRVEKNDLSSLPDELNKLVKLKKLNLSFNSLTTIDNVPLGSFTDLDELHLSNNQLDHLSRGLGKCKKLRVLDASHNQLKSVVRGL